MSRNAFESGLLVHMIDEGQVKDLQFVTHPFTRDANGMMMLNPYLLPCQRSTVINSLKILLVVYVESMQRENHIYSSTSIIRIKTAYTDPMVRTLRSFVMHGRCGKKENHWKQ